MSKYKLWVSPDARQYTKEKYEALNLKTHTPSAWHCFNEKKQSDRFCIAFGHKENNDAGFSIMCSVEDAKALVTILQDAINKGI